MEKIKYAVVKWENGKDEIIAVCSTYENAVNVMEGLMIVDEGKYTIEHIY